MPKKYSRQPTIDPMTVSRPGQDVAVTRQQSAQFPGVGVTLRSYKYDPRDHHKFPAGQGVIVKQGRFSRLRRLFTLRKSVLILSLLVLLIGGWVGGKFVYNAHKLFGGSILGVLTTTKLKGEGSGRVNILLAGNSADDPGHNGGKLTDSIMIASINTKHNKAFIMSVPRDLWVNIPGEGHAKINETYVDGEAADFSEDGYPSGGMGLLEKVIERNFGLDINYYALVNYNALKQAVDAVGGVDYTVKSVDPRGLYDPNIDYATGTPLVRLSNGVHHLNGQQALDLSRARGDSYRSYGFPASDFDRTEHQRELIVALKTKAVTAGVLANPAKLSSLSDAIGNNVKTDFSLSEVRRLFDISKSLPGNKISSLSLNDVDGKNLLDSYSSRSGQSALIPALGVDEFDDIKSFLKRQTSSNPLVQEGATVTVLNATDSSGLATKQKTILTSKSLYVKRVGDAPTNQAVTSIIDNSGGKKPATRQVLIAQYGNNVTAVNPFGSQYSADFIVLIGSDQIPKTTTPRQ